MLDSLKLKDVTTKCFFYHNPHYKTKNITLTRYCCIFPAPSTKERIKLKQFDIEVNIIIKMKIYDLCLNWQIGL